MASATAWPARSFARSSCRLRPGQNAASNAGHMLDFESLHAAPDQLLTYFFWAEDIGPDGQPRRTSGDMFFAEVRPFEEIFRQGEQPPSGSAENEEQEGEQGNAQASDQLAELQKEVINGYLEIDPARDRVRSRPPSSSTTARCWRRRSTAVIEQAAQLAGRLQRRAIEGQPRAATRSMKDAENHLGEVAQQIVGSGLEHGPRRRTGRVSGAAQAACARVRGDPALAPAAAERSELGQQPVAQTAPAARAHRGRQPLRRAAHRAGPARKPLATRARTARNVAGPQSPARAGPASERRERAAQRAAIGSRGRQDAGVRARRSSGSSSGSESSSNRSSAIPTSSASGWRTTRTANGWPTHASRSTRAASTCVRRPRHSNRAACPRP